MRLIISTLLFLFAALGLCSVSESIEHKLSALENQLADIRAGAEGWAAFSSGAIDALKRFDVTKTVIQTYEVQPTLYWTAMGDYVATQTFVTGTKGRALKSVYAGLVKVYAELGLDEAVTINTDITTTIDITTTLTRATATSTADVGDESTILTGSESGFSSSASSTSSRSATTTAAMVTSTTRTSTTSAPTASSPPADSPAGRVSAGLFGVVIAGVVALIAVL